VPTGRRLPHPQRRRAGHPGKEKSLELRVKGKVAAAVLLPTGFVGFGAEGLLLAPTGGQNVGRRNAEANEVFLDGVGATLTEGEVVFGGTALVAVAFDSEAR